MVRKSGKTVTFEDELIKCVNPSSDFNAEEFVHRITPKFIAVRDFTVHSSAPFFSIRVWIRNLTRDYLLVEEFFPKGTCEHKVRFEGFFSTYNSNSELEILIFGNSDKPVRATLCYRNYHSPVIPSRGSRTKELMTRGPRSRNPQFNQLCIYVDGYDLVVEHGEYCAPNDSITSNEIH